MKFYSKIIFFERFNLKKEIAARKKGVFILAGAAVLGASTVLFTGMGAGLLVLGFMGWFILFVFPSPNQIILSRQAERC